MADQEPTKAGLPTDDPYAVSTSDLSHGLPRSMFWNALFLGLFVFVGSTLIGVVALWAISVAILIGANSYDPSEFLLTQMSVRQRVQFASAISILLIFSALVGNLTRRKTERVLNRRKDAADRRRLLSEQVNELRSALDEQSQTEE